MNEEYGFKIQYPNQTEKFEYYTTFGFDTRPTQDYSDSQWVVHTEQKNNVFIVFGPEKMKNVYNRPFAISIASNLEFASYPDRESFTIGPHSIKRVDEYLINSHPTYLTTLYFPKKPYDIKSYSLELKNKDMIGFLFLNGCALFDKPPQLTTEFAIFINSFEFID